MRFQINTIVSPPILYRNCFSILKVGNDVCCLLLQPANITSLVNKEEKKGLGIHFAYFLSKDPAVCFPLSFLFLPPLDLFGGNG